MLLADTDIPVIEISFYVGINSRQYFSNLFKKHTNMTPIEYRKSVSQDIVKFSR
ncbi:AraC-like DNA-binding protein [Neobacillus niacini]|uniref:helix-turn-helix domain-containing protein n=1 Tax=Neobacillus driksii TaxID=3035913 RepID=UPI00277F6073|nr:AraC family transcriptional regulator [Neobacillus niacini]MDQ0971538.1 AraC-like DNA-binding protein [Neobacillus niacini]